MGNVDRKRFPVSIVVNTKNNIELLAKNKKFVVDYGIRKLSNRPFTIVVSLPKLAIKNCADGQFYKVKIQLVNDNGEKYLKLTPVFDLEKVIY